MACKACEERYMHALNPERNRKSISTARASYKFNWTIQNNPYPCRLPSYVKLGRLTAAVEVSSRRKATAMTAATPIPGDLQTEVLSLVPAELSCDTTFPNGQPPCHPCIARAAEALAAGEVVAIPTETVYGLAANALSACAVGRVYTAKNRPADNPLIVHVSSLDMLASLYPPGWALPSVYEAIVRDLWPGPLTILLPRSHLVPDVVTCGQSTMAVRMPAHPVALALIAACGFPLAAPSANSSGRPSPTLARHVLDDLGGRVPLILDGGACTYGVESTVLDGLRNPPAILRPGGITHEQLAGYPGLEGLQLYRRDFVDPQLEAAPSTPGMKYRHYSPNAPVLLLDPGDAPAASVSDEALAARLRIGTELLLEELHAQRRDAGVAASRNECDGTGTQARTMEQQQPQGQGDPNSHEMPTVVRPVVQVGVLRTSLLGLRTGPMPHRHSSESSSLLSCPSPSTCANGGSALDSRSEQQAPGLQPGVSRQQDKLEEARQGDLWPQRLPPYEYVLGHVSRPAAVASELYAALRHMDEVGVAVIVVEGVRDTGAGVAVMNRLRKAASRVVAV